MTVDDDLIAKFLSGEASPEEAMALHDWLKNPANKARFAEMEATWNKAYPSKKVRAVNREEAWRNVRPAKAILAWRTIGIAASVFFVVYAGLQYFYSTSAPVLSKVESGDSTKYVTFTDQSTVTLNRNSEIYFPKDFEADKREVSLKKGEAFFSVKKDPQKPFKVVTSVASIEVVGTEFNVTLHDNAVDVSVSEGVVLVVSSLDSVYVRQGSTVTFRQAEKAVSKENDPNTWAYATHALSFKDLPMQQVIAAVEKTYACSVSVSNDNINKCALTGYFNSDSAEEVLHLISETLNLTLQQNGQVFTLEGDGCP